MPLNLTTCKQCDNDKRLSGGHCCDLNEIYDGVKCIEDTSMAITSKIDNCNKYDSFY